MFLWKSLRNREVFWSRHLKDIWKISKLSLISYNQVFKTKAAISLIDGLTYQCNQVIDKLQNKLWKLNQRETNKEERHQQRRSLLRIYTHKKHLLIRILRESQLDLIWLPWRKRSQMGPKFRYLNEEHKKFNLEEAMDKAQHKKKVKIVLFEHVKVQAMHSMVRRQLLLSPRMLSFHHRT